MADYISKIVEYDDWQIIWPVLPQGEKGKAGDCISDIVSIPGADVILPDKRGNSITTSCWLAVKFQC